VLDASITPEYIGKFALYIRVRQVGGTLGDLSAQIDVMLSKSTGFPLLFRSDKVYPAALSRNEMLYLGMLEIPSDTPLYEFGNIRIQVNVENNPAAADGDLYLYDLILMPADECLISIEGNSTSENCVGYTFAENRIQFIDSITNPKRKVFAEVRGVNIYTGDESSVTDISIPIYNNALSIFPNSAQRIWFCVESDDNDPLYRVVFETVFTVMIEKQQRYLAMRGTK
jgi:hypothetical protein